MRTKILVISPAWLGDIIMSQSLLSTLKEQNHDAEITVYAPLYAHSVLERMSEVDYILENPFKHGDLSLKERYLEGKKLRLAKFDKVYILPNSLKSALVPYFAKIKERIALKGESRYILVNKMRLNKEDFPRMVERYVSLAYIDDLKVTSEANLPHFAYPSLQVKALSPELIQRLNLKQERPWIAFGAGANYGPAKLWPVEYFAEVAHNFIQQGFLVLAFGTQQDQETITKIKSHLDDTTQENFYDLAGKTSLVEVIDLLAKCKGAVCNDSGLMHTVAAVNVPQVCIFGSTSTRYTPPLSAKAQCIESKESCHPCFKRTCSLGTYQCLKGINPQDVITKLSELLAKFP